MRVAAGRPDVSWSPRPERTPAGRSVISASKSVRYSTSHRGRRGSARRRRAPGCVHPRDAVEEELVVVTGVSRRLGPGRCSRTVRSRLRVGARWAPGDASVTRRGCAAPSDARTRRQRDRRELWKPTVTTIDRPTAAHRTVWPSSLPDERDRIAPTDAAALPGVDLVVVVTTVHRRTAAMASEPTSSGQHSRNRGRPQRWAGAAGSGRRDPITSRTATLFLTPLRATAAKAAR
jgi:hypothetical protein